MSQLKQLEEDALHLGFGEIRIEKLGPVTREVRGTIANISQGAVHVKVSHFLATGPVRVWFSKTCHSDGSLIFCSAEDNGYRAGIHFPPDPQQHKRSALRVPLNNERAVVFQLECQTQPKYDAQAIDISSSGLGLLVDRPLTIKTWVKVELTFAIVFGEVVYSKAEPDGGFRVGLRTETLFMRDNHVGTNAELLNRPSPCE
jgi:hypothetical protein